MGIVRCDGSVCTPEVTSTLIHTGPGAGSLIEAAAAWQRVAVELENSVSSYASTLSSLIESWDGPSAMAMLQSVQPYLLWLRETAQQSAQLANSAEAAATAFGTVRSTVVHPSVVSANRTRLAQLLATNRFGTNTAAIAETENEYQTMWANNSAALSRYQAASSQATSPLTQFNSPLAVTDPGGTANQQAAVMKASVDSSGSSVGSVLNDLNMPGGFDPNAGWFNYFSTWGNQFISSGFPINLLGVWAQLATAQGSRPSAATSAPACPKAWARPPPAWPTRSRALAPERWRRAARWASGCRWAS